MYNEIILREMKGEVPRFEYGILRVFMYWYEKSDIVPSFRDFLLWGFWEFKQ